MDTEELRRTVREIVAAIAPESAAQTLQPDRPLREQIDLDSMDWVNLLAGLQERLHVEIPEADRGRLATLDALVAYLARQLAGGTRATPAAPLSAMPSRHKVDGNEVTLRPVTTADAALEADFVRGLSAEARYKRFMRTVNELPDAKLKYLTDVDGVRHVALAATVARDGREELVGVARYIVDPAGQGCEFAITVADAWQGSGVAGILMHALITTARSRGLKCMEGTVLATNRRMLKFARQMGFALQHDPEDRETVRAMMML